MIQCNVKYLQIQNFHGLFNSFAAKKNIEENVI